MDVPRYETLIATARRMIDSHTIATITVFAAVLTVSAFVLETGFGILPCPMCWWQRYVHWAILAIGLVAIVPAAAPVRRPALAVIGLAAIAGLVIALWQSGAQWGLLGYPDSCTSAGQQLNFSTSDIMGALNQRGTIPCDLETFRLFWLSLANWNIFAMIAVIALAVRGLLLPRSML